MTVLEPKITGPEAAALCRNLRDAGVSEKGIRQFFDQPESRRTLLEKHRKNLLDRVHRTESQIECLDYLIYQMKKQSDDIV